MSIPITLVTGFLGAGKSTLINKVIADNPQQKFGLVVNEFGEVKLESHIVESEEEAITELSNGCMCCVVRSDLVETAASLLKKAPGIAHIILEASGLSDPVPIANTFLNDDLRGRVHFDAILCVVDPTRLEESLRDYPVSRIQLEYADFILMSKADIASSTELEAARNLVESINPQAKVLTLGEDFPTDLVFDTAGVDHSDIAGLRMEEHHHHEGEEADHEGSGYHHAHEAVDTLFFSTDQPFDLEAFGRLVKGLPREIIRAKGFLSFDDPKARRQKYVFQLVGSRPILDSKAWKKGERPSSALVFIGRGFDKAKLESRLISCLSSRGQD